MDKNVNMAIGALALVGGLELVGTAVGMGAAIPNILGSTAQIVGGAAGLSVLVLADRILGLSKMVQ